MSGIEMRAAHFPGRAPVDAYGNGGFRFAGMSHKGSILCLPDGVHGWQPKLPARFEAEDFSKVFAQSDDVEILLIGTGLSLLPIPHDLRRVCRSCDISADSMSTGAAVRTYNVLLAEDRAVAGAFLAVDLA